MTNSLTNLTPERITRLEKDEVFVFGSNYAGRHGKGAALLAVRKFGARHGQGMGAMGQSYGIATKDERLRVLSLTKIEVQVARFLRYAAQHSSKRFLVTQIGCGLAGYKPRDIAPMFADSPDNISLPACFVSVLNSLRAAGDLLAASPGSESAGWWRVVGWTTGTKPNFPVTSLFPIATRAEAVEWAEVRDLRDATFHHEQPTQNAEKK